MNSLLHWSDTLVGLYRVGRCLTLMFDYDGTLTRIVEHPSQALLPETTREVLSTLADLDGVNVGILSGRSLADLKSLVDLKNLYYAGSAGMHVEIDGKEIKDVHMEEFDSISWSIEASLADRLAEYPGTWIERKPGCLSVHYRSLTATLAPRFRMLIRGTLIDRIGPKVQVRDVTRALEVTLRGCWTKGDAVALIRRAATTSPFVLYAGDAGNDADAVAHVNAIGGLTIGIGRESPIDVNVRLDSPEMLLSDLSLLVRDLKTVRVMRKFSFAKVQDFN